MDRNGIPVTLITAIPALAEMTGASRITPAVSIVHPCGDPSLSPQDDHDLRRRIVLTALRALESPVDKVRIFPTPPQTPS